MLDVLQVLFWSITYVLVIIAGFRSRKAKLVSMPYVAGVLNFVWEAIALYDSRGDWSHVLWFSLDLVIVMFGFRYCRSNKKRLLYAIAILLGAILHFYIFKYPGGKLYSVFIIDLIMAICFLVERKKLSPELKGPIAVTKLIGDAFAGLCYAPQSGLVAVIAIAVFVCNLCYLNQCIGEKKQ